MSEQDDRAKGGDSGESHAVLPSLSLPKGGGAIRGIGEKFAANPVTGTGTLSVPIFTSPGRSGFGPQLSISYDSGSGNGPFGFGWKLSLPSITRKTDKGLPRYQDLDESDVFILSGAEDLVPAMIYQNGDLYYHDDFTIQRYRPRIEGLFARIERWTNKNTGEINWRSISKDNITTIYGKSAGSRIADPADPKRIFSWLICESYDDKGNAIFYEYKVEDSANVYTSKVQEANRDDLTRSANRYIKRIRYGNKSPHRPGEDLSQRANWLFEVVFDYGEHDPKVPTTGETRSWPVRQDTFSSYRSGFEVRTYRLCHRALMFHHFPAELGKEDYLVRSTDFAYRESPIASFVTQISQSGYVLRDEGEYLKRSIPPLEFEYSQATIHDEIKDIDAESLENLPYGLDEALYQWVDLDGEGISGILTEQANAWFYKPNLGEGEFGPLITVSTKPSLAPISSGRQQLMDLAADGRLDLVQLSGPVPGFYERTEDRGWDQFKPLNSLPNVDWDDPNLKFLDLTGDGHADIVISEDEAITWYPSLAEEGFGPSTKVRKSYDEETGPKLVFADGSQSIYLTDMSGDGLTDLVRIRNGEVCYWPNLGYGRFGAKVTMDNAPWFDYPDIFDQRRIRLADIDGTGVADIIYLGRDGVFIYLNQSGNGWSEAHTLNQFPPVDNLTSVMVVDLLGNGTACIVWSSPLPGDAGQLMHYIDLMGGQKPHLLVTTKNNLGSETRVNYDSSTNFYLADREAGTPWITRLPFPVQVVERVEVYDRISRNRFVTRYAYHHGYFDATEREFRGFGMVEQWDTEDYATLSASDIFPIGDNVDAASHVPPLHTKTWFHTGIYLGRDRVSRFFAGLIDERDQGKYYREPKWHDDDVEAAKQLLKDTILPDGLTVEEEREACRALKGSMLRQEIYALDGTIKEQNPYTVAEQNFTIRLVQPRGNNLHAAFFVHAREAITYNYERNPKDPRISHALTLEVDDFGNVLKSAVVGYGRRRAEHNLSEIEDEQTKILITCTENSFTNGVFEPDAYRVPLACEACNYELTGLDLASGEIRFSFDEILDAVDEANSIEYELAPSSGLRKRIIEHVRTLYRKNDLSGPLPLGELESAALPYEGYELAFTPGLLNRVYGPKVTDSMLSDGGYVHSEGDSNWWIPSGKVFYSPDEDGAPEAELEFAEVHFFLPHRFQDPFEKTYSVTYDKHGLLTLETRDPLDNVVSVVTRDEFGDDLVALDYRVMQPCMVTGPNSNRSAAAFDALGMVVGTAVMGKVGEDLGDTLVGFEPDLDEATIIDHVQNPLASPHELLQKASARLVYDLYAYQRTCNDPQPQSAVVYTIARESHESDLGTGELTKVQHSFSYSDGFGREIQKKVQAEPGEVEGAQVDVRWVGSGWTIFNNKGKPIKKYEPFFSATHRFEFAKVVGVSSTLFYDPLGRTVATLHPNHTHEKVVFDPWRQETWDVNDTVLQNPKNDPDVGEFFSRLPDKEYLPTWHDGRKNGQMGDSEQDAASKAAKHAGTPALVHFDALGRSFLIVADNGDHVKYETRVELDIEGNQRAVFDARGRTVMRYEYNLLGSLIQQDSMDAGTRWVLNDVAGNPVCGWDGRGHRLSHVYDSLRRQTHLYLSVEDGDDSEKLVERTVYGEAHPDSNSPDGTPAPGKLNLRGRVFMQLDGAGALINAGRNTENGEEEAYDFKGNLLRATRCLAVEYKDTVDWSAVESLLSERSAVESLLSEPALDLSEIESVLPRLVDPEHFASSTTHDALNRPITLTSPDNSVILPYYNEANLLERVEATLHGGTERMTFVENINYNAKGQRESIVYGNGAKTTYEYDCETFRLIHLKTLGKENSRVENKVFQDLRYAYDPVGNITSIRDDAQQTIYFSGEKVKPEAKYIYDAIYRLIKADGREHPGQSTPPTWDDKYRVDLPHPHDGKLCRYSERYEYDEVGNILCIRHSNGGLNSNINWNRAYSYDEPSFIDDGVDLNKNNRLTSTEVGGATENYIYDAHGNMTKMPHLEAMEWDFKDLLHVVDKRSEKAYYVYGASGQRVRKVIELEDGRLKEERLYLGIFEIYRSYNGDGHAVKLERETLQIMDDTQRIALVETRTQGIDDSPDQVVRYQFRNHLGSASLELDDLCRVIYYEEYYPYGCTSYQGVRRDIQVPLKRYRYTGKERDEESGLYYHGARYYAPWLGRWCSTDPKGLVDGVNLYSYANGNPIIYKDPLGTHVTDNRENGPGIGDLNDILDNKARYLFTVGGGWIDSYHTSNSGKVFYVLQQLIQGQESVTLSENYGSAQFIRTYSNINGYDVNNFQEVKRRAVSIVYNFLYEYEQFQGTRYIDVYGKSSFSYEDLPSNRVGIEIGVKLFEEALRLYNTGEIESDVIQLPYDRLKNDEPFIEQLEWETTYHVLTDLGPIDDYETESYYYDYLASETGEDPDNLREENREKDLDVSIPRNVHVRPLYHEILSPIDPNRIPQYLQTPPETPENLGITKSGTAIPPPEDVRQGDDLYIQILQELIH